MELFKLVGVVMFAFVPIVLLVRYWSSWSSRNTFERGIWRLVTAVLLAGWYGGLPIVFANSVKLRPLVPPTDSPDVQFLGILILLVSISIFLAAQQGSYVNRLDEKRRTGQSYIPEYDAAYFFVHCGFWAFSLVVVALIGLVGVHIARADSAAYGVYEWLIAVLFIGGWIVLMAGALARFRFELRPAEQRNASIEEREALKKEIVTGESAKTEPPEYP